MSMRQRATKCLGKLPDKPRSRPSTSTSPPWPGHHVRWNDERETSKLMPASSPAPSVESEHLYRSRENVKAWLESSPTSVLDDQPDDESASSSFESLNSSPARSEYRGFSSQFGSVSSRVNQPRVRAISPPRISANRNSEDVSRIDAGRYSGGSFLTLAFKNAQYRGSPSPPAFQYMSGALSNDHFEDFNAFEECGSPGSEFSLTSEWQNMLSAGNAAGMSTRDSTSNNSDYETPYEALNSSELGLSSANSIFRVHPQVVSKPCRTQSMELPQVSRSQERSASGQLKEEKSTVQNATARNSAPLKKTYERRPSVKYEISDLQRIGRRNPEPPTYMQEVFEHVQRHKVHSHAAPWEEVKSSKLTSRYEKEEREIKSWEEQQRAKATATMKDAELKLELKRARLIEKMENDMAMARRKAEEKKAIAEAKRAEKAARAATDAKFKKRTGKVPRGCLFLG